MSHVPNELHEEFPESVDRIHALKLKDAHFAKMADHYHELNRTIHRAETDVEPMSDEALEVLKKKRLAMLDEIATVLQSPAK